MKTSYFSIIFAASVLIAPLGVSAQAAPQASIVGATAPGKAAVGESVQLQGKVESIDKKERTVVVVGPQGNKVVFNLGDDVRNFDQLRVGDLVTLTYLQAVAIELRKVPNTGIRERDESVQTARAQMGQKPAGVIENTVRVVADVTAIDLKTQTISLRGAQHTIDLTVKDPAQLNGIKIGDQVEALYMDAVALQVTAAKK